MDGETGVGWWAKPGHAPVYLIVEGGRVIACPPYTEQWALGKATGVLLGRAELLHAIVEWIPLAEAPTLLLSHLTDKRPIRRWRREWRMVSGAVAELLLTFGETGAGGWFVSDTSEIHLWRYSLAVEAWAECERRRRRAGTWTRVHAMYGPRGEVLAVEDDPKLPDGLSED